MSELRLRDVMWVGPSGEMYTVNSDGQLILLNPMTRKQQASHNRLQRKIKKLLNGGGHCFKRRKGNGLAIVSTQITKTSTDEEPYLSIPIEPYTP